MDITTKSYQTALDVQDACNLSGIVRAWLKEIDNIKAYARDNDKGSDFVNSHPINKLFANKLADLCGASTFGEYFVAYTECKKLSVEGDR